MKSQISLIAAGLFVATMALGFAAVGHLPSFKSREVAPLVHGAELTGAGARRIYCFIGMKGEPGSLYRGWVCDEVSPRQN